MRTTLHLLALATIAMTFDAAPAGAYIHFPPPTLQRMCKDSHEIRVLKITKLSKEKGIIIFEAGDSLKGHQQSRIKSFKHVIRTDADGVKPILDWAEEGKTAVMFWIEGNKGGGVPAGIAYVFIDNYCYSVDYNGREEYWLLIRAEPGLSTCYYGPVDKLQETAKAILDGRTVEVPVKAPPEPDPREKHFPEINDVLNRNRSDGKGPTTQAASKKE